MSTADQPSIGDTGEHNGECQGKGESDQSRKRKSDQSRGEDDPMEAGAAPGAHIDTHDLGIANPPTPAPTEAKLGGPRYQAMSSSVPAVCISRAFQRKPVCLRGHRGGFGTGCGRCIPTRKRQPLSRRVHSRRLSGRTDDRVVWR